MKKISIIALSLLTAVGAMAQANVVKDAERAYKGDKPDRKAIRNMIKPALTNAETEKSAQAWYVAGANEYKNYDELDAFNRMGKKVDTNDMSQSLLDGFKYFMTALSLDSMPDAKGKIKPKYSKDITKTIASHLGDYDQIAVNYYNNNNFKGAYEAWDVLLEIPGNPRLGKEAPAALADTIISTYRFNQALAAYRAEMYNEALKCFKAAKDFGYPDEAVYEYGMSAAAQAGKNDEVLALAEEALPKYGKTNPKYIGVIINGYIEKKDYTTAQNMLEKAIANDPQNAQLHDALGILFESQKTEDMPKDQAAALDEKAYGCYEKAVQANPEFARGNFDLGRKIQDKAFVISDASSNSSQAEYNKIKEEQIFPLFRQAAVYLEKAYTLDADNMRDALRYLRNIYYNLNDESNLSRIEGLLNK